MIKYYDAYDERYKIAHDEGILWFLDEPTPEVEEWIHFNNIPIDDEICEIGCGEGRDALYLATLGYKITAADVSKEAIAKCRDLAKEKDVIINWINYDALFISEVIFNKFKWIYSVATLHMLVDINDRKKFLESLFNLLEPKGKLLLVSKGDGTAERATDKSKAFNLVKRNHPTGKTINVPVISYIERNFENHQKELIEAGFDIEKIFISENNTYEKCINVYLTRS